LRQTANHHLASAGLVYPTFYRSLFKDLRVELAAVAQQAQAAGKGLWPQDVTISGVKITGMSSVTEEAVILPKLFRRLVDYLNLGMPVTPGSPRTWLVGRISSHRRHSPPAGRPRGQPRWAVSPGLRSRAGVRPRRS
jgi:hypothetical protein